MVIRGSTGQPGALAATIHDAGNLVQAVCDAILLDANGAEGEGVEALSTEMAAHAD